MKILNENKKGKFAYFQSQEDIDDMLHDIKESGDGKYAEDLKEFIKAGETCITEDMYNEFNKYASTYLFGFWTHVIEYVASKFNVNLWIDIDEQAIYDGDSTYEQQIAFKLIRDYPNKFKYI